MQFKTNFYLDKDSNTLFLLVYRSVFSCAETSSPLQDGSPAHHKEYLLMPHGASVSESQWKQYKSKTIVRVFQLRIPFLMEGDSQHL